MEFIQKNDKILLLWDSSFDLQSSDFSVENIKTTYGASINFENVERLSLGIVIFIIKHLRTKHFELMNNFIIISASYENSTFTLIVLKISEDKDIQFLATLLKLLKPKGRLVSSTQNSQKVLENLKLAGFVNSSVNGNGEITHFMLFLRKYTS